MGVFFLEYYKIFSQAYAKVYHHTKNKKTPQNKSAVFVELITGFEPVTSSLVCHKWQKEQGRDITC